MNGAVVHATIDFDKNLRNTKKERFTELKKKLLQLIPVYAVLPLAVEVILNSLVYGGTKLIVGSWYHYNIETSLDMQIPFLPWTVSIYFGCYLFWIVNYIICVRQGEKEAYQFLSADFLAKWICLLFFLVFPTTNTRPEITGNGFWDMAMKFLYRVDSADNLFPSSHCLTSWFCYIGIRRRKNVPAIYRSFSCIMAIAVFLSTLTTKQHVLVDVAGGVLLAEISYFIASHTKLAGYYGKASRRITKRIIPKNLF